MRRIGFPEDFRGLEPSVFCSPDEQLPEVFTARGRWKAGPMHTFCDDYRQEFFWRRPSEGLIVALSAGVITAPDFTVWNDDPKEWAEYQVWRSALVASFWQSNGVTVLPVLTFAGSPERFVKSGSTWAVRGSVDPAWILNCCKAVKRCAVGRLVVFGRCPDEDFVKCPVVRRVLVSSKYPEISHAAQKEG